MKYILTPDQMRAADADAIRLLGISAQRLMENAAEECCRVIKPLIASHETHILVACGSGNNGGDGFAIARLLMHSARLRVVWLGDETRMSPETKHNYDLCVQLGVTCEHISSRDDVSSSSLRDADIIIDALIGVGGSSDLRGVVVNLLERLNHVNAIRIAIDVPTGLDAASGEAHEHCFRADHTISVAAAKTGMWLEDGPNVCGSIHVVPIGIPDELLHVHAAIESIDDQEARRLIPPRTRKSSKFDYGRVCIIAGSRDMPGAAALCANAIIRSGAGLVELCSTSFHAALQPEVLQTHCSENLEGGISADEFERISRSCDKADVILLGSGVGPSSDTADLLRRIIDKYVEEKYVVVDADGLRAIDATRTYGARLIITPHDREFGHLTHSQADHVTAQTFSRSMGCCIVLKTIPVSISFLQWQLWNTNGNPGMATAGSGDVLAGIVAAMLCRLRPVVPLEAAALGVYLHASAGDRAATVYSQESVTASTMLEQLPFVFKQILDQRSRA